MRMSKNLKLWLSMMLITLVAVELLAYLSVHLLPSNLFESAERRQRVFSQMTEENYKKYTQPTNGILPLAHPDMGWDMSYNLKYTRKNCLGREYTITNLDHGVRSNSSNPESYYADSKYQDSVILAVGDSYTHGDETIDDNTYPAQLQKKLGIGVANLGVSGYCPLQSVMKLEDKIKHFPKARIVLLNIMYEDMYRLQNGYRAAYARVASALNYKPYYDSGKFVPLSPTLWKNFEEAKAGMEYAMDNDYMSKALPQFPYTLTLAKVLSSPFLYLDVLRWFRRVTGQPPPHTFLDMPGMKESFRAVLQRYKDFADKHNVKPVLVFIPQRKNDIYSGKGMLEFAREHFGDSFVYIDVKKGINFERYTIADRCHPTIYGYERIAHTVALALKKNLAEEL